MNSDSNLVPSNGPSRSVGRPSRPAKANAFDAQKGLHALRRRWLLVSVLGSITAAAAAACVWFFLPPGKQTAARTLQVYTVSPEDRLRGEGERLRDPSSGTRSPSSAAGSSSTRPFARRRWRISPSSRTLTHPLDWLEKELRGSVSRPAPS